MENGNKLVLTGSIFFIISFLIPSEINSGFGIFGLIFILNGILQIKELSMVLTCFSTVGIVILGILTTTFYYNNLFSTIIFTIISVGIFLSYIKSIKTKNVQMYWMN